MAARTKAAVYFGVYVPDDVDNRLRIRLRELWVKDYDRPRMTDHELVGAVADQYDVEVIQVSTMRGDPVYLFHPKGCSVRGYEYIHARLMDDLQDPGEEELAKLLRLIEDLGEHIPIEHRTPAWRLYLWRG